MKALHNKKVAWLDFGLFVDSKNILLSFFLFFSIKFYIENACVNPRQQNGVCIPLFKCDSLVRILRERPVSQENKVFLGKSQCGWEDPQPLVCCTDGIPQRNQPARPTTTTANRLLPTPGDGVCGIDTSERIFGGEVTKIDEYPWLALLGYDKPGGGRGFHCGGVLISDRYGKNPFES